MSVARVTEIKAASTKSFDDAVKQGVARAVKTLKNVKSAGLKIRTCASMMTAIFQNIAYS